MARFRRASRYSRSSRRGSRVVRRRAAYGRRPRRTVTRRRRGTAGVLAEVKYVNNIANRGRNPADDIWANDSTVGPMVLHFDAGSAPVQISPAIVPGSFVRYFSYSSYGMLLTHCQQGFSVSRRVGLAINPRSFIIRLNCTAASRKNAIVGGVNPNTYGLDPENLTSGGMGTDRARFLRTSLRFVVYRDMEPVYTGLSTQEVRQWGDLFSSQTATGSVTDFLRTDNIGRFNVVYDSTVILDNDDPQKDLQIRVPMPKVLRYGGAVGNQTRSGHYFIMACANILSPMVPDADHPMNSAEFIPPAVAMQHRMAYTDQ